MPQTHQHHPQTTPQQSHVGLLLLPAHQLTTPPADPAAWHGIDPHRLARLIAHYTRAGDVVLDLDNHPGVAHAARYLHRHPATLVTDGDHTDVRATAQRPESGGLADVAERGVSLLLTGLPRSVGGLHELAEVMRRWHRLLRPGGFVLIALAPTGAEPRPVPHRSTVVTAARAAGLRYHQHLPVLLVPLPAVEPRTDAATAAITRPALLGGRHVPVHLDVLAFAASSIDQGAVRA
ncbi:hypothetical protein GCM10020358_58280 [Amorphoplanes nipponensis]|uniref:Methyltransferase domain-containing protein n=1 Tax=Actinoplanes nipponensis TaxID=135950 RepID=A0A919JNN2_9ACTN|nr:hypothetical protein [Actinoplanes nipponensis]GIE52530.1 hypothetical protein Ani05nite_60640 [Actinoplanes nipponensis]